MLEVLFSFVSLILVLVLAYFGTRYFAKTYHKMQRTSSMHIVESMMLERDKRLLIVKVHERYLALVSHANGVENLGECVGYVEPIQTQTQDLKPFEAVLKQLMLNKGDKHDKKE